MNYRAYLISRERLKRNWSQEGLCRGICAVSYLSKIESGKAEPSEQIFSLLLERLGLEYRPEMETEAAALADDCFELLLSCRYEQLNERLKDAELSRFRTAAAAPELEMLEAFQIRHKALDTALEDCMDNRCLALQRILQQRQEEALLLYPCAFTYLTAGIAAYSVGNYSHALERLRKAFDMGASEGRAKIMLMSRVFMGNCFCNRQDIPNMELNYAVARRLAEDLGDGEIIASIDYNTASTWVETGRYEDAYKWFSALEKPGMLALHKLAICCEKTGRRREGLMALDRAEAMDIPDTEEIDTELARQMCALVRFRLENADYLSREDYGEALLGCFERCRRELGYGYALFHLPWVLEWYKATRQYKKACELMEAFPAKGC